MKISADLACRVLHHFALDKAQPDIRYLAALLNAYVQTVPWESASRIVRRAPHPKPYLFTVHNTPVSDADYRGAAIADYGPNGLFLHEVNINKVVNGELWRFSSRELPLHVQRFVNHKRIDTPIEGDLNHAAHLIARTFGMDAATLREALAGVALG